MVRSMTGFGEAERDTPAGRLRAEVRTVNHRFFSANLKLARSLERFEPLVRESLRTAMPRGHANFTLRIVAPEAESAAGSLQVDEARAREYFALLQTLQKRLGLPGQIDIAMIARYGDILTTADESDVAIEAEDVRRVTESATAAAVIMREEEGRRLAVDLQERLSAIEQVLVRIAERAPGRLVAERDRIRRVVTELLEDVAIDEDRVAREVAFLAEKWDVSEEMVRLRSHIDLFRQYLAIDASEPVGKRLGFLVQEMNRETNTIGSKANDAAIEHAVVAIKDEIERLREQVENIE